MNLLYRSRLPCQQASPARKYTNIQQLDLYVFATSATFTSDKWMQSARQTPGVSHRAGVTQLNRVAAWRCRCSCPHQQPVISTQALPLTSQHALHAFCCDVERSSMVHEELQLFINQLALDNQEKRALSYRAHRQVKRVRRKKQKVEIALEDLRARKATISLQLGVQLGTADASREGWTKTAAPAAVATRTVEPIIKPGVSVGVADLTTQGVQLRIAIARALEREDYLAAAGLRDALTRLEEQAAISPAMAQLRNVQEGIRRQPRLSLGQRAWHVQYGYRAVVVGWDSCCCESTAWREGCRKAAAQHASTRTGILPQANQYHYHVLVDARDWEPQGNLTSGCAQVPVAYVAEELLWAPEHGGMVPEVVFNRARLSSSGHVIGGASWAQVFGDDAFQHPLLAQLFSGRDKRGNYVPIRQW